jgi:hypothetical protein
VTLDPYRYDDSHVSTDFPDDGVGVLGGRIGGQLEWEETAGGDSWAAHLTYEKAIDLETDEKARMTCVISRRPGAAGEPPIFVLMTETADVESRSYSEFGDLDIAMLIAQGWARERFYLLQEDMPEEQDLSEDDE